MWPRCMSSGVDCNRQRGKEQPSVRIQRDVISRTSKGESVDTPTTGDNIIGVMIYVEVIPRLQPGKDVNIRSIRRRTRLAGR